MTILYAISQKIQHQDTNNATTLAKIPMFRFLYDLIH